MTPNKKEAGMTINEIGKETHVWFYNNNEWMIEMK